jgi:hypothetical protein
MLKWEFISDKDTGAAVGVAMLDVTSGVGVSGGAAGGSLGTGLEGASGVVVGSGSVGAVVPGGQMLSKVRSPSGGV